MTNNYNCEDCGIILTETPAVVTLTREEAAKIAADVFNCNNGDSVECAHKRSLALKTMNHITFSKCDRFDLDDILDRLGC